MNNENIMLTSEEEEMLVEQERKYWAELTVEELGQRIDESRS